MTSGDSVVRLERHQAVALVSSAQWVHHLVREGQLGVNSDERQVAMDELREAIDAATVQLARAPRRERAAWWGLAAAALGVCAATLLIEMCHVIGMPRTVVGLYIPVVVGVALLIGRWSALLGCGLAFVLNDVVFVHPWRFSPGPEQVAVFAVVVLSCLALNWLARGRTPLARLLPPDTGALTSM
jgi:K+-sensing histidine kinase KdpD